MGAVGIFLTAGRGRHPILRTRSHRPAPQWVNGSAAGFHTDATGKLFSTDGTPEGTYIQDLGGNILELTPFNGLIYFLCDEQLWKPDGTPAGTALVYTFDSISSITAPRIAVANGRMLIKAAGAGTGQEFFISDGTTAGTQLLKDINPGIGAATVRATSIFPFGSRFFFSATNGITSGLWTSEGTADGTVMMADASPYALIDDTLLMRKGSMLAKLVERDSL
jgi:ELWxxDGT repeat protein